MCDGGEASGKIDPFRIRIRIQPLTTRGQSKEINPSPVATLPHSKLGRKAYLVFFGGTGSRKPGNSGHKTGARPSRC
ncbi:hypothetical protein CDAR_371671 [Caerostris darwini]|uniref:Uncharacterized protein n=1 Tax=Caerostris darwini TaxID=1538125 RepID=A0AAV4X9P5_9ARAC|nr:hypothetical protein CDAR_371671 [Caerostris darwini]